ncbi:LysR family transcriptional regulator [Kaustia mangrovi]|uniref:LysR family transcriptional regulator n=1 Tax=Kaustia mangrovi TaxID=2593653 RepID=A0A7S8C3M3_9HYPH|nr:LysR family transcriptional regulator [Kaustia mangrovi]QPC42784.1 LysR family transcriptional regulator [Kaustia mangrovi]
MFGSLELRHLRYFMAAHEHGSFRKAGSALGIRESTISRAIRDLEDALGASLFQRYAGGVRLTFAGEKFLRRTRSVVQQVSDGAKDVAAIGRCESGYIRIGVTFSFASGFLHDLLRKYCEQHADVRIDFIDGDPVEHIAKIRKLQLDIAFVAGARKWLHCETNILWTERIFIALPDRHHLIKSDEIYWNDLSEEKLIVSDLALESGISNYILQVKHDYNFNPKIITQSVGRDNLLSLVAAGRGLTIISEAATVARIPGVIYRSIACERIPFSAVWLSQTDNPALRRLLSMSRLISNAAS